ncbi:MAG: 2-dehydropantoate 2-reductase, partial [Ilumatobacteraceae bacterium]
AVRRFVVYGAGAVGGVVGGRMFEHGHDVVLVARGDHGRAIAEHGLTVEWPEGSVTLPVPVVADAAGLTFRPGDVVLVAVKSQDTAGVVAALVDHAPPDTPIVCVQNGVANEPVFLRWFRSVHGVTVMAPTEHLEPGVVRSNAAGAMALLDIGRWPSGVDDVDRHVARAFRASGFASVPRPDIARWKHTKLLVNLGNVVDALCPHDDDARRLMALARREGVAVLAAAGIDHVSTEEDRARRGDLLRQPDVPGRARSGSSTWQSLLRGTSLEVDHLNGEIVRLGRLHGVATPVNEVLQHSARRAGAAGRAPRSVAAADLLAIVDG